MTLQTVANCRKLHWVMFYEARYVANLSFLNRGGLGKSYRSFCRTLRVSWKLPIKGEKSPAVKKAWSKGSHFTHAKWRTNHVENRGENKIIFWPFDVIFGTWNMCDIAHLEARSTNPVLQIINPKPSRTHCLPAFIKVYCCFDTARGHLILPRVSYIVPFLVFNIVPMCHYCCKHWKNYGLYQFWQTFTYISLQSIISKNIVMFCFFACFSLIFFVCF